MPLFDDVFEDVLTAQDDIGFCDEIAARRATPVVAYRIGRHIACNEVFGQREFDDLFGNR